MMNYFADLFIQLDHLEIDVHHQTGPHPIAASIATMQRFHNIVAITKGDNTYPSNFRFDARHPGVVAALGHIADAADADMPESGMLAYARLLRASDRPEQLDAVIAALTARKAESLAFYQLAARACLQRDRLDQAAELVRAGTARHGDDAVLLSIGAGIAQRQGDRKAAIGLLERALEIDPHLSGSCRTSAAVAGRTERPAPRRRSTTASLVAVQTIV